MPHRTKGWTPPRGYHGCLTIYGGGAVSPCAAGLHEVCSIPRSNPNAEADAHLIAAAPSLLAALEDMVTRHAEAARCAPYRRGAKYENKAARPRNDGRFYRFALYGPEGSGFYPCACNAARAAIASAEGGA